MGWVVLGLIAAIAVYLIMTYNGLVAMRQRVNQAFADIDVQLKQRHDLIPNLVETVKGYATHEKTTLDAVIAARNAAQGAGSIRMTRRRPSSNCRVRSGGCWHWARPIPDLKASANFQQLQVDLGNVEDKLAAARRFFNNAVSEFNAADPGLARPCSSRRRWAPASASSSMSAKPRAPRSRSRRA